jgi:hypothetical protein
MDEILNHLLIGIGIVFVLILLCGLYARRKWRLGLQSNKSSFWPDENTCRGVQQGLPKWRTKAKELLTYRPVATPVGFLLSVIWLAVISINVFILAQVLELFFPGGEKVKVPWFGIYTFIPLVLGGLYAFSETIIAILHEVFKSKWGKIGLVILIVLMILAEGYLAYYRTWLIRLGDEPMSPTMVDAVMFKSGPILSALIALFVATSETLGGRFSFQLFIDGTIKASISWLGGIIVWIWCGVAYWLFGFLPPIETEKTTIFVEPAWLTNLRKESNDLDERVRSLVTRTNDLLKRSERLPQQPKTIDSYQRDMESLCVGEGSGIRITKTKWEEAVRLTESELREIRSFRQLSRTKDHIKTSHKAIIRDVESIQTKVNLLYEQISRVPKEFEHWQSQVNLFNENLIEVKSQPETLAIKRVALEENARSKLLGLGDLTDKNSLLQKEFLSDILTTLSTIAVSLDRIRSNADNLAGINTRSQFPKETYDSLLTQVLLFTSNDVPSHGEEARSKIQEMWSLYKEYRFKLILRKLSFWKRKNGHLHDHNSSSSTNIPNRTPKSEELN